MPDVASRLAESLWELFLPEIKGGEPVRFCFGAEILREHFALTNLTRDDPVSYVCSAARTCFNVSSNRAWLPLETLTIGDSGVSKVIVLVCQQVLAVEEMVREGTQYSENAYFPRLRKLMDPGLPPWSINPFSFDDFEAIWKTFAREVWRVEGSTDQTITFEFDIYAGVNKARQFPLSQALFSRADLVELARHCGLGRLQDRAASEVWREIRRERYHLSRRAQTLINSGFLRERIVDQVQKFVGRISAKDLAQRAPPSNAVEDAGLFISLDIIDWVHEEYRAHLVDRKAVTRIDNEREVSRKFDELFRRNDYFFCVLNKLGDCWTFCEGVVDVPPGEAILLIAREGGIQRGKAALAEHAPPLSLEEARVRTMGADTSIYVAPVSLPIDLVRGVRIRAGAIVADPVEAGDEGTAGRWLGGLCIEARQQKFLRPFLPSSIRFGAQEISVQRLVRVGDSRMDWKRFTNSVAKLESDGQFDMYFADGCKARLAVAVRRDIPSERMGFVFDAEGRLSPTLERLGRTDLAVIGFFTPDQRVERPAEVRTVAALLSDLRARCGRPLTEKERHVAWARVSTSAVPLTVKRVIGELLRRQPLARDEVLSELLGIQLK